VIFHLYINIYLLAIVCRKSECTHANRNTPDAEENTDMADKAKVQAERMKTQTIGVEIEMNHITRQKAAEVVSSYFGTEAYEASREYGYCAWACKDTDGRVWKFQKDVSIAGPEAEKTELVTPVLHYEDIATLQEIARLLRKAGAVSCPAVGAGVHCHIGADGHDAKTLRNLANIMASHESLLIEALNIDRYRIDRYCRTVDPDFLKAINRRKPETWMSSRAFGTEATNTEGITIIIPHGIMC